MISLFQNNMRVSPFIASICACLDKQPEDWDITYTGEIDKDLAGLPNLTSEERIISSSKAERIRHRGSGVVLNLDTTNHQWEVWHPRCWLNRREIERLNDAVNAWGALRLEFFSNPPKEDELIVTLEETEDKPLVSDKDLFEIGPEAEDDDESWFNARNDWRR